MTILELIYNSDNWKLPDIYALLVHFQTSLQVLKSDLVLVFQKYKDELIATKLYEYQTHYKTSITMRKSGFASGKCDNILILIFLTEPSRGLASRHFLH